MSPETLELLDGEVLEDLLWSHQQSILHNLDILCDKWEVHREWVGRQVCLLVGSPAKNYGSETRKPY